MMVPPEQLPCPTNAYNLARIGLGHRTGLVFFKGEQRPAWSAKDRPWRKAVTPQEGIVKNVPN